MALKLQFMFSYFQQHIRGSFKRYVTQWSGGVKFSDKKRYEGVQRCEVSNVQINNIM